MTALNMATTPQFAELLNLMMGLTVTERLLLARLLLDSILDKEIDEEADWQRLSISSFESDWENDEDANG